MPTSLASSLWAAQVAAATPFPDARLNTRLEAVADRPGGQASGRISPSRCRLASGKSDLSFPGQQPFRVGRLACRGHLADDQAVTAHHRMRAPGSDS
jgi:hypothetical protein